MPKTEFAGPAIQAPTFEPVGTSASQRDENLINVLKDQVASSSNNLQQKVNDGFQNAKSQFNNQINDVAEAGSQAKDDVAQALENSFQNSFAADPPAPKPPTTLYPPIESNNDFQIAPSEIPTREVAKPAAPPASNDFESYPAQRVPTDFENQNSQFQLASTTAAPLNPQPTASASLNATWPKVDQLVNAGNFRGALGMLSKFNGEPSLSAEENQKLAGWLDGLAGKVIYAPDHTLFAKPYVVQANETLTDIAGRWGVPAQLVYNVNRARIPNPAALTTGTEIKMVTGPFNGTLDLTDSTLTLYWKNLYAGRFNVRLGSMGNLRQGQYRVITKRSEGHPYRDAQANVHDVGAPGNGYGPNWIGMDKGLCIHAIGENMTAGHPGCIGLSAKDAADMYGILSENSTITIVR